MEQVDTQKAKVKIDKDAVIRELNGIIERLKKEMDRKNEEIQDLKNQQNGNSNLKPMSSVNNPRISVFNRLDILNTQISQAKIEKWLFFCIICDWLERH